MRPETAWRGGSKATKEPQLRRSFIPKPRTSEAPASEFELRGYQGPGNSRARLLAQRSWLENALYVANVKMGRSRLPAPFRAWRMERSRLPAPFRASEWSGRVFPLRFARGEWVGRVFPLRFARQNGAVASSRSVLRAGKGGKVPHFSKRAGALSRGGEYTLISPDAEGRVYSKKLDLHFSIDTQTEELVIVDAMTGERLRISDEEEAERVEAKRLLAEETAARQEEAAARQQAEAEKRREIEARQKAEQLNQELMAELIRLRAQIHKA